MIFDSKHDLTWKYLHFKLILSLYESDIDQHHVVYMTVGMEYKPVGDYLRPSEVPYDLHNLYGEIMDMYYSKNGALEVVEI